MPSVTRFRLVLGAVAILALAGAVGACSSDQPSEARSVEVAGESVPTDRLEAVAGAVCRAARVAATDPAAARAVFFGEAHEGLHTLARALGDADRPKAADVLEAKQLVEADLSSGKDGTALGTDLVRLAATVRGGLDRLEIAVPACEPKPRKDSGS
jgi:uncharacterized membrane protein